MVAGRSHGVSAGWGLQARAQGAGGSRRFALLTAVARHERRGTGGRPGKTPSHSHSSHQPGWFTATVSRAGCWAAASAAGCTLPASERRHSRQTLGTAGRLAAHCRMPPAACRWLPTTNKSPRSGSWPAAASAGRLAARGCRCRPGAAGRSATALPAGGQGRLGFWGLRSSETQSCGAGSKRSGRREGWAPPDQEAGGAQVLQRREERSELAKTMTASPTVTLRHCRLAIQAPRCRPQPTSNSSSRHVRRPWIRGRGAHWAAWAWRPRWHGFKWRPLRIFCLKWIASLDA